MKIFLSGYYGAKNLGDELLLLKVIEDILAIAPQAEFFVWSIDKDFTNRFLKDYPASAVDRFNPEDTVNAVKSSDLVVLGGGGIVQEYYGIKIEDLFKDFGYHVVSYAIPPFLGKIFGKKVFYWCLGHGPVVTEEALYFSRWFYSLADCITVRDEASFEEVSSLVSKDKVYLDADPLLHFDFKRWAVEKKEPNILGVAIRKWFFEETLVEKVGRALKRLLSERPELKVALIPCDLNLDPEVLGRLQALLPDDRLVRFEIEGIEDIVRAISLCQWFVGMRLHSLICAYKLGLPFLALSYDGKTEEFVKSVGAQSVKVVELTEEELFLKLKVLISSKPLGVREFTYKTPEIFKAFINNEILAEQGELKDVKVDSYTLGYLQDFVKTLLQQREELQTKISSFQRLSEELRSENEELRSELEELRTENEELRSKLEGLRTENEELKAQRDYYFNKLNEIYTSNFWKLARTYYKIRYNTPLRYLKPIGKTLKKFWVPINKSYKAETLEKEVKELLSLIENYKNQGKYVFIYPPTVDWNIPLYQRPQHFATEIAKLGHLFIFCTPNSCYDKIEGYTVINENLFITNLWSELIRHNDGLENTYIILYSTNPFIRYSELTKFKQQGLKIIYDYVDEIHPDIAGGVSISLERHEKLKEEDVLMVCCVSKKLYNEMLNRFSEKKVLYLPNGVEFEHFNVDKNKIPKPLEIEKLKGVERTIVGYYGALAKWIDYSLLEYIAKALPEVDIVLIGVDYDGSLQQLLNAKPPNIHYLGKVPYSQLPKYAIWFDVAIIPFQEGEIAKATSPIKMYEYMALGKPIVVTKDLLECYGYDYVFVSKTKEEFVENIKKALQIKDDPEVINRLKEVAKQNSWQARVETLIKRIEELENEA